MNKNKEKISYEIFVNSVGQGLFLEITLNLLNGGKFRIVYDCGSTRESHIKKAISASITRCNEPIDLLIISHFDKDHINGVLELLSKRAVRRVMLPYMSVELRIASAVLSQNCYLTTEQELFIRNPIEEIRSRVIGLHGTTPFIYIVRGEADDFAPDLQNESLYESNQFQIIDIGEDIFSIINSKGMPLGKSEFEVIPYNDIGQLGSNLYNFKRKIKKYINKLIEFNSDLDERRTAFKQLKTDYSTVFGKSAYRKNLISLFTYIGPLVQTNESLAQISAKQDNNPKGDVEFSIQSPKAALLLTGDGYLNSPKRVEGLRNGLRKIDLNLACLQVSHHGAKSSWYRGLARDLDPIIAIFSSDPNSHYKHPHESVIRDFSNNVLLFADVQRWSEVSVSVS